MENALNIVKRAIFKEIIKLTLLKRFAIIPSSFKLHLLYKLYLFTLKYFFFS